ncbi:hypothetical protein LV28_20625 [Pandoraea pnomenusa]|uniref:Uncharacterized protein n=1 Tax=Pandoraea pnomenusa TaxID=93220 RepID=A0A378YV47_9BURK|nr:hypothetical protein [Pandoraea pnomenusa]AIU28646.1 hypothetical protein LV28_20625 [Pandoraea pnomenusa]SUA81056.1 Uncharacterised protein [Pandoraea pnomenusa]
MQSDDEVFTVSGITASASALIRLGLLQRDPQGAFLTTGKFPHRPIPAAPPDFSSAPAPDPYSPEGLTRRGYHVLRGETFDQDRVMIGGGYYRITEARKHGLI